MMGITERQENLLIKIVQEYINLAHPISSELLEKKYALEISPATIRIEMQKLTDAGLLFQPHTSAGRVPTDKAYRFLVNEIFENDSFEFEKESLLKEVKSIENEIRDSLRFFQEFTKIFAAKASNIAITYLSDEKIFWKDGWQETFQEPEFKDANYARAFIAMVENFEKDINDFLPENGKIKVFIGKENPIPNSQEFSLIISGGKFPKRKKGVLAILGPKRMDYDKNIGLMNSLNEILTDIY